MTKRLLLPCLALAAFSFTGCLHSKTGAKPKDASVSSEVEADLHRHFIDRRVAELTAQGTAADAARTQAEEEFRVRYGFISAPPK